MSHITRLYTDSINQHTNARMLWQFSVGFKSHLIIDTFVFLFLEGQKREKTQLNCFLMVRFRGLLQR